MRSRKPRNPEYSLPVSLQEVKAGDVLAEDQHLSRSPFYVCVYLSLYVCICTHVSMYMCIDACRCLHIPIYVWIFICVIYAYMYRHIYVYYINNIHRYVRVFVYACNRFEALVRALWGKLLWAAGPWGVLQKVQRSFGM